MIKGLLLQLSILGLWVVDDLERQTCALRHGTEEWKLSWLHIAMFFMSRFHPT